MKHHPDLQQTEIGKKKNGEILKKIVEAYQVLRDPKKRRNYDMYGTE